MGVLDMLYSWIPRPFPNPGTGNMAFRQNTALPMYDVRGSGRPVYHQFSAFAPPITNTQTVRPEGFGGIFHGQIALQALSKPNNGS